MAKLNKQQIEDLKWIDERIVILENRREINEMIHRGRMLTDISSMIMVVTVGGLLIWLS